LTPLAGSPPVYCGLDFGEKTIGVAVSLNGRVATGVTTLRRKDAAALRPCLKELKLIIRKYGINHIVLGYPRHLNGDESPRCEATSAFKEKLGRYFKNVNVLLWDERLSTRAVSRAFGKKINKRVNHKVDEMAAVYILQGFLDSTKLRNGGVISTVIPAENGKEKLMENQNDDANRIIVANEDGDERSLLILASSQDETGMYVLAADEDDENEVFHFKFSPEAPDDDGEEDFVLEQIGKEHEDYTRVFEMFKDDYEEFGIDV